VRRIPTAPVAAGSLIVGLCTAAMALSRSPVLAATLLVGCEAGLALAATTRRARLIAMATCAAVVLVACGGALAYASNRFPAASHLYYIEWARWFSTSHGLPGTRDAIWLARNASWYAWPLWPLAAWSLYAWRHHWRAAHIGLPATLLASLAIGLLASSPFAEPKFVPMIAPMAILAAFAMPTLRRAPQQWVDWFGITIFTLFVLFIWVYFLAWINGSPSAMAHSVMRLIPGYTPDPSTVPLLVALAVTGFWVGLIVWRVHGRPKYLWRGAWLSAAGMSSLWLIAVALFLPAVNHNRSYRDLAVQTGQRIGAGNCVVAVGVSAPIRAILAYEGSIHFAREEGQASPHSPCRYALQAVYRRQATAAQLPPPALPASEAGAWDLVWEGRRLVRNDESWRLWRLRRNQ